ncbi:hypothetical protein L7F22_025830 [Adiantum nelumboides]|nr:hypothetical protein [Adiantum nelumboides]
MKRDCPHLKGKELKTEDSGAIPLSNAVPDVQGNTSMEPQKRQLLKAWGKLEGQNALVLFDSGSTDNFISSEMAKALKLQASSMGVLIEASSAFEEGAMHVTPIIGKLKIQIGDYNDHEEFLITPKSDVLLGMPWHHRTQPQPNFRDKTIIVSLKRLMKKSIFAYLIFVNDSKHVKAENQPFNHAFLSSFNDCFTTELPTGLPPSRQEDHKIDQVPGSAAPNQTPYRVSASQQEEILSQVNELLEKGLIRPSSSPYCSPILLVQKKDGSFRMCVDYRSLNKITIKNHFPIPRIDDILDSLRGASIFSRLDLKSGYNQIRVAPQDVHKTAFRTSFGLYEFLVMPFGLTNAPATFNLMMNSIFQPHRAFTGIFFDDVLVFSKSEEEHKEHLRIVFEEFRQHKLFVNPKKSEFFLKEIHYLGHIVSHNKNTEGNEPESLTDEPIDAELFQTTTAAVEELDPEWMEVQEVLQSGKIPKDLSNSRKKGLIVKSLKFTLIGGSLYRLGIDGVLRRMVYGTEAVVPLEFAVPSLRMAEQYDMDFNTVLKKRLVETR